MFGFNRHRESSLEHVDESSFQEKVLDSQVPVLVDFYADWCGPCRALAPVLEEVAGQTPGAKVVKLNVDHSPSLAAQYGISAIPSLKVFKGGKVVAQHVGMTDKRHLQALLTQ